MGLRKVARGSAAASQCMPYDHLIGCLPPPLRCTTIADDLFNQREALRDHLPGELQKHTTKAKELGRHLDECDAAQWR